MDQLSLGRTDRIPFLESILNALGQGMLVIDDRQTIIAANPTLIALLQDLGIDTPVGSALSDFLASFHDRSPRAEALKTAILAATKSATALKPQQTTAGGHTLEIRGNPLPGVGYLMAVEDISDKIALEDERRVRQILDHSPIGVSIVGQDGLRRYANRKLKEILGLSDAEMLTKHAEDSYADPKLRRRLLEEMRIEGSVENREAEFVRADGSHHWVLVSCRPFDYDGEECVLGWLYEITDRIELERRQIRSREELEIQVLELRDREERMQQQASELEELAVKLSASERRMAELANFDMLTGLPTARLCHDRMEQAMANARRNQTIMALMYVDLDGFKAVNDTFGHDAGDQVLRESARRMSKCFRDTDTVARIGGDEFLVVLWGLGFRDAVVPLAERLLACFVEDFCVDVGKAHIGASIGIAFFNGASDTPDSLIKRADKAMYVAKKGGKNRYVIG